MTYLENPKKSMKNHHKEKEGFIKSQEMKLIYRNQAFNYTNNDPLGDI